MISITFYYLGANITKIVESRLVQFGSSFKRTLFLWKKPSVQTFSGEKTKLPNLAEYYQKVHLTINAMPWQELRHRILYIFFPKEAQKKVTAHQSFKHPIGTTKTPSFR